jgi:hypothetical protein
VARRNNLHHIGSSSYCAQLTLIHLAFQSRSNFHCCFTPADILFLFTAMSLDGKQRMANNGWQDNPVLEHPWAC